jgi:hypothetical protein
MDTAYTSAMQGCIVALMRQGSLESNQIQALTLRDLPDGAHKTVLLRRRFTAGLSMCPNSRVLVDEDGGPIPPEVVTR